MVADRVIRGICHDLNGRINSLTSLSYLLNTGNKEWARVGPLVEEELKWTEELSRLLRVLPDEKQGPRLLAPGEFLPQVLRLVRLQAGLEGVEWELRVPSDFPAIRVDEALLLRALVLLLTGVAEETRGQEGARIEIQGQAETRTLTIRSGRVGPGKKPQSGPDGEGKRVTGRMELLLAEVLQEMGGELAPAQASDGGFLLELRLPGLEA